MEWVLFLMFIIAKYKKHLRWRERISTIKFTKTCINSITTRGLAIVYRGCLFAKKGEIHICWGVIAWEGREAGNQYRRVLHVGSTGCLYFDFLFCRLMNTGKVGYSMLGRVIVFLENLGFDFFVLYILKVGWVGMFVSVIWDWSWFGLGVRYK